ncbi:hypothetical protein [Streptomyces xiamenensis]|uniref:hypothetical protein n=1 Tax=Streptomyces xiamenensis TaxID=408015 RepID=UPI003D75378C
MRITARQTTARTTTDLDRAIEREQPVTVTYLAEETRDVIAVDSTGQAVRRTVKTGGHVEIVRTIEPRERITTRAGHTVIKALCRKSGGHRSYRLDRLVSYTVHRSSRLVAEPAPASDPSPQPANDRNAMNPAHIPARCPDGHPSHHYTVSDMSGARYDGTRPAEAYTALRAALAQDSSAYVAALTADGSAHCPLATRHMTALATR